MRGCHRVELNPLDGLAARTTEPAGFALEAVAVHRVHQDALDLEAVALEACCRGR